MRKTGANYVLITSVVWAAILACVLIYFLRRHQVHQPIAEAPTPMLAVGPEVSTASVGKPSTAKAEMPLSPVQLTPQQIQSIGVMTGLPQFKQLDDDLRVSGTVAINDRLLSYVQVRFSGYIRKVFANATYQYVKKGQPLFTIYSPDLVATQQEFLLARENQRALSRSSIGDVASDAGALSTAAERRLEQWEVPASELEELKRTGKVLPDLTIQSPASGYIIERNALPNMYAEPSTRLYTIADLSRVWVNAQVFQNDVGRLKPGDSSAITVDAYPQKIFRGRVEAVLPQVDMTTRTVQVRLSIENAGLHLKPGMFVNVQLKSSLGRRLVVPASAIFQTGLRQLIFLNRGDGRIEPKEVVTGPRVGDEVVILSGLDPHQSIITSANFLIDSESQLQAASGQGAAAPAPTTSDSLSSDKQVKIDFTVNQNQLHKGANGVQVKATDSQGAPVSGVDVTVTSFMPAMPAMGMAAVKNSSRLSNASGGLYQGSIELPTGGLWQLTITVKHGETVLATKQLRMSVEGGM
jgi:RND family efflux transporter MFP subunit